MRIEAAVLLSYIDCGACCRAIDCALERETGDQLYDNGDRYLGKR
jgi:hypothetical protein